MTTTLDLPNTAPDVDAVADALLTQLFVGRERLPRGRNGKDPGCSTEYTETLRVQVLNKRAIPIHMILRLFKEFAANGVAHSELLTFAHELHAALEVLCVKDFARRIDHPLPVLIQMDSQQETKLEGPVNYAQDCLVADPLNPVALESYLRAATKHDVARKRLTTRVARTLAVVRGQSRPVVGARSLRIHA